MASTNYKNVREIKSNDWNIHIFGVVKFFRPPTKIQKTGQYQMTITIIDESVGQDIETGIRCNIFDCEGKLPQVKKVGDIILLKQMKVKVYNGMLQVQKSITYQWVVFGTDRNYTGNHYITVETTSLPAPVVTHYDRQRVRDLLDFLDSTKSKIIESENSEESDNKITLLSDAKVNTYIDVIVQVIGVNEFVNSSAKSLLLKVSDGTKVSFNSLYQMGNIKRKETNDIEKATKEFSCDISVFDDHVSDVEKLKVGDFVKITNLHVKTVSKELLQKWKEEMKAQGSDNHTEWNEMIVHSGTKYGRGIKILLNNDPHLISLKNRIARLTNSHHAKMAIDNIMQTIDGQDNHINENSKMTKRHSLDEQPHPCGNPNLDEPRLQESLTTTDFLLKPLTSINSIKHSKGNGNRFRLHAKVLCIKPSSFTDIIIGRCGKCRRTSKPFTKQCNKIPLQCPTCKDGSLTLTYFFRLLVEDETGLLDIISCGDDALYFFNNISPMVLVRETAFMSNFEEKLGKFDNYQESIDISTVPFIDICICTHEVSNVMKYWMFGTSLV